MSFNPLWGQIAKKKADKTNPVVTALFQSNCEDKVVLYNTEITAVRAVPREYLKLKEVHLPNVLAVHDRAFYEQGITTANLPSALSVHEYAFYQCSSLKTVNIPNLCDAGEACFWGCAALEEISFPILEDVPVQFLVKGTSLKRVDLPEARTLGNECFRECTSLEKIDLQKVTSVGGSAFSGCTSLTTVIARTTETVCSVVLTAFNNTPMLNGLGHIYVPASMYEYYRAGYETALNAETMPGFFDILFRKIEDYPDICGAN